MSSSIIRSARVAAEPRSLPVAPPSSVDARKSPAQPGAAATSQGSSGGQSQVTSGDPSAAPLQTMQAGPSAAGGAVPSATATASGTGKLVAAPAITYEEYKQRFAGELAEAHRQVIDGAREQGLQQGRRAAEAEYRQQLETLRTLLESVRNGRSAYVEDLADDAAEIVFAAVTRILGEGFADQSAVSAAVRAAIQQHKGRSKLLVRVAPRQLELLEARRREWLEGTTVSEIELVGDERVVLGGCVLESAGGNLDARLETQLRHLREALVRARARWSDADE